MKTAHTPEAYRSYQNEVRDVVLRHRARYRKLYLRTILAYSQPPIECLSVYHIVLLL